MSSESSDDRSPRRSSSRRTFLQSSVGAATGVAITVVTPAAAVLALSPAPADAAALPEAVATDPVFAVPSEPVTAYLRDAASGEVTVLSGTVERTYRDPVLAKRLVDAARSQDPTMSEVK